MIKGYKHIGFKGFGLGGKIASFWLLGLLLCNACVPTVEPPQNGLSELRFGTKRGVVPEKWGVKLDRINKTDVYAAGYIVSPDTGLIRFRVGELMAANHFDTANYHHLKVDTIDRYVYALMQRKNQFKKYVICIESLDMKMDEFNYYVFYGRELNNIAYEDMLRFYNSLLAYK